jgi:anti-anti-sigma factor
MASRLHSSTASAVDGKENGVCIINETPEIHFRRTTTLTPEQFVDGLTDFRPGRSKLSSNRADEYLKVHYVGRSEADVTEGSLGIWERLYYDWSDPNQVVLTTIDSNVWGGTSGYTYALARQPNGTTDIDVAVVREGKNFKGWMLGFVLRTIGRHVLKKAFEKSIKAIEVRNGLVNLTTSPNRTNNEPSSEEQLSMPRTVLNANEDLEIAVSKRDDSSFVRLRGRVNVDSSPALRDRLMALLRAQSPKAVIVDLSDVAYLDSSGLATLIEGLGVARMRQTTLCVQGLHGRVLQLFQATRLSSLFEKNGCDGASPVAQVS